MKLKNRKTMPFFTAGFTLIEMIVSIALFSFVMLAVTTVLLSVVDANHKAQGLKSSMNNLSLALESMTRNLRTGKIYSVAGFNGCSGGGSTGIDFIDHASVATRYSLGSSGNGGGAILLTKSGNLLGPMTALEINIDRLCFYVSGQSTADLFQPQVLITIGGVVSDKTAIGAKVKTRSRFDIETLVSQRFPDVLRN